MSGHPSWIKVRVPTPAQSAGMAEMRDLLARHDLETVCQGAQCPNAVECWSARTATFMVLGDTCTRGCRFCDVSTGNPRGILDETEPLRLAAAVRELGLNYVVLTSVDRDDVPDGGAEAFAHCVEAITAAAADVVIEVLMPDFGGDTKALDRMIATKAGVFGHNLETVRRLTPALRDRRAGYDQSLGVLQHLASVSEGRAVKSGLMVGLGESLEEVQEAMADLRAAGVTMLTLGQYLQPSSAAVPVARFVSPEEFERLETDARNLGFKAVVAGPLVRSSYHAAAAYDAA